MFYGDSRPILLQIKRIEPIGIEPRVHDVCSQTVIRVHESFWQKFVMLVIFRTKLQKSEKAKGKNQRVRLPIFPGKVK